MNETRPRRRARQRFRAERTNFQSAEIATYCADVENCGFYLSPVHARELFHVSNETRALKACMRM